MKITRPTLFLTISCLILGKSYSVEWSYEFPEKWPGMCQTGRSQSPIDITEKNLRKVDDFEPFVFHGFDLTPDTAVLKNDGHTAAMDFSEGVDHHFPNFGLRVGQTIPTLSGGGLDSRFQFHSLHFHWGPELSEYKPVLGSEHTIGGKSYPMEIHMVHFNSEYGSTIGKALQKPNATDNLAVLGTFAYLQEEDNPKLEPIYWAIDKIIKSGKSAKMTAFPLVDLLPRNTDSFYRYNGSLTTPGCDEVVVWSVFKDTIGISARQLKKFRTIQDSQGKLILQNFRPTQEINNREILDVETSTKIFSPRFAKPQNRPYANIDELGIVDGNVDYV